MAYSDRDSSAFCGTSQRCQLATLYIPEFAVSTTAARFWQLDSAEIGAVNACITVFNSGSTTIRVRCYVSNDKDAIPSNAGRVTLSNLYDETDTTQALPFSITAGSTKHLILSYKEQPILTTFRYWDFYLDTAASTSTAFVYGNAK